MVSRAYLNRKHGPVPVDFPVLLGFMGFFWISENVDLQLPSIYCVYLRRYYYMQ